MFVLYNRSLNLNINVFWCETNRSVHVFVLGNIFISRKSVASCDECDEDDGLTTSVVYKIGKLPPQFLCNNFHHLNVLLFLLLIFLNCTQLHGLKSTLYVFPLQVILVM